MFLLFCFFTPQYYGGTANSEYCYTNQVITDIPSRGYTIPSKLVKRMTNLLIPATMSLIARKQIVELLTVLSSLLIFLWLTNKHWTCAAPTSLLHEIDGFHCNWSIIWYRGRTQLGGSLGPLKLLAKLRWKVTWISTVQDHPRAWLTVTQIVATSSDAKRKDIDTADILTATATWYRGLSSPISQIHADGAELSTIKRLPRRLVL